MPDTAYDFLTNFFVQHLSFTPTSGQIADFEADLHLVSPFLMEAALIEVKNGSLKALLASDSRQWRSAIFKVYNRKVAEHAQLFPVFHTFETSLRSTVVVYLEKYYDHRRWWRRIYEELRRGNQATTVSDINNIFVSKDTAHAIGEIILAIDGNNFQKQLVGKFLNGYQFIEYCNLAHVGRLIEVHWSAFSPLFINNTTRLSLSDFKSHFSRVRDARNDIYHHKSVARTSNVISSAEKILDYLDCSLSFVCSKISESSPVPHSFGIPVQPRHRCW